MIDHAQGSGFTSRSDPFEATGEHADAVGQKGAVGGMMNIGFGTNSLSALALPRTFRRSRENCPGTLGYARQAVATGKRNR